MASIKDILDKRGLAAHKRFGQNFLVNPRVADQIVALAGLSADDTAIEFGVGFGALTKPLSRLVRRVIGLEVDRGIIQWHKEEGDLPDNVVIRHEDILKADLNALAEESGHRLKILANLPYSITNPTLFRLVENRELIDHAVLMVQKEVGLRLMARPGTKEYGVLSVILRACAVVEPLMHLGPAQFHPRPRVDSMVVRISFSSPPDILATLPSPVWDVFRKIVNAAFQKRRKTLANSLAAARLRGIEDDKGKIIAILETIGISAMERPERLNAADFAAIAQAFSSSAGSS